MKSIELAEGWSFWRNAEGTGEPEIVRVPHDAMIGEKRSPDAPSGRDGSYFHGGIYRYEYSLEIKRAWAKKKLVLEFECVYRNATVLFDGQELAYHAYGFTGFYVELPGGLKSGSTHTVTVIADNSEQPNSRWYSGSGIFRPVRLHVLPERHIALDGVRIETVSTIPAVVRVRTEADDGDVSVEIVRAGRTVASGEGRDISLTVPDAALWSAEDPALYEARISLGDGGKVLDEQTVRFGIRSLSWSKDGLFVNGESIKLRGGCIHSDNGILGAEDNRAADFRKVALLKRWGFNAIRSAHNPLSKNTLDACDELGMYVMDEYADMWFAAKNPYDYARDFEACWEDDLAAMVAKDINRPSVILYSIGNENMEPCTERGVEAAHMLVERLHKLDPTRPATAGVNLTILFQTSLGMGVFNGDGSRDENPQPTGSSLYNLYVTKLGSIMNLVSRLPQVGWINEPYLSELDICGYNYATIRYGHDLRKHPERLFVGSETMCYDLAKNWRMVEANPRLLGDFMWTALDYLGEVSLAGWSDDPEPMNKPYPWIAADSGALDLIGDPNGEAAMAAVVWDAPAAGDAPLIYVRPCNLPNPVKAPWRGTNSVPSWTWLGCEGTKTTVEVYTKAPIVKLYQDGRHVWTKRTHDCHADFSVRYQPGKLVALACTSDGRELSRAELATAEGPLELFLCREGDGAPAAGDTVFVDVVLGRGGVPEGNADRPVTVAVEGGELLAFGSAAQKSELSYLSGTYPTRFGRALAAVRVTDPGACTIRATADAGLSAELTL